MADGKLTIAAPWSAADQTRAAVLVIRADERDRLLMRAALDATRYKLHFASDGFEVRAILATEFVPVVIMDGDAQSPSWRELLKQMADDEARPSPRFILVSRHADARLWAEVLNLGGYDLLPKPLDAEELARVVRSAMLERNVTRSPARPAEAREEYAWNAY